MLLCSFAFKDFLHQENSERYYPELAKTIFLQNYLKFNVFTVNFNLFLISDSTL